VARSDVRRFTSYDRSPATGLGYAVNCHYDPQQRRFTQVDPIGMRASSLTDPQSGEGKIEVKSLQRATAQRFLLSCHLLLILNVLVAAIGDGREGVKRDRTDKSFVNAPTRTRNNVPWSVPVCGNKETLKRGKGKRIRTETLQFTVPNDLTLRKVQDADYVEYVIFEKGAGKGKAQSDHLEVWYGPTSVTSSPPQKLARSARTLIERTWICDKLKGIDTSGVSVDGVRWRWISLPLGQAHYETRSEKLAGRFNLVIDSMCCDLKLLAH
jgi:hypothetical protein